MTKPLYICELSPYIIQNICNNVQIQRNTYIIFWKIWSITPAETSGGRKLASVTKRNVNTIFEQ